MIVPEKEEHAREEPTRRVRQTKGSFLSTYGQLTRSNDELQAEMHNNEMIHLC